MDASDLTFKNQAVLEVMTEMCNEHGVAPTIRQMTEKLGFKSPNSVMVHLKRLIEAGKVTQIGAGQARGYVPVEWHMKLKEALALCTKKPEPATEEMANV